MSLRTRSLRAVLWVSLTRYTTRAISLVTHLLLARLLAPEAFGLVAITSVVLGAIRIFQDLGLGKSLIARSSNSDRELNAAFYVSIALGAILSGGLFVLAPLVAVFFSNGAVAPLLKALSVRLLISSFAIVPHALLQKELRFRSLTWPGLAGALAFTIVSIPLALSGFGAWSIVLGSIAQSTLVTVGVWLLVAWRPSLEFDWKAARELLSYSKHLVGVSFAAFLHQSLDTVMVGRLLGVRVLGYYDLAFAAANTIPVLVMQTLTPVLLPALSEIQNERERMANLHVRLVKYLLILLVFPALFLIMLNKDVILTLYGTKWREAVLPFQILCAYAVLRQVAATNGPVLIVVGKAKTLSHVVYLQLALLLVLSAPVLLKWGLPGMGYLMVGTSAVGCGLLFPITSQRLRVPITRYMTLLFSPLSAGFLFSVGLMSLNYFHILDITDFAPETFLTNIAKLIIKGLVSLTVYAGAIYGLDKTVRSDVRSNLSQLGAKGRLKTLFQQ